MTPDETLQYFQERQSATVEAIREIVDIESPSYDLEKSAVVADWIEKQIASIPLDTTFERIKADGFGEHIVIRAFNTGDPHTLLLGHTDTVHPLNTNLQNPTRIEGDKFYGCGIFDMKANIVLMFEALRYFSMIGTKPSRPITILLSCDEEIGSHTGRPLVEREATKSASCLVLEPSADGRVKTGRKGTGMYKLLAHGLPAHAGLEPEKGANAIAELARQIEKIHVVANPEFGTTVNVTSFHGGTATNVIPEHAECEIDVRFSKIAESERIDADLRSLSPFNTRISLELAGGINRPPLERTAEVVAYYEKARDLAGSFGYELGETQVGGASDGNFVAAMGVSILDGLGIKGAGAHMLTEHILISDIAKRATLITLLLSN